MNFVDSDDALLCVLPAKLDTAISQQIEEILKNKIATANKKIIFDFAEVIFVSSYFLRICLSSYQTVGQDAFEIANMKSEIKKVFMIAGFDKIMKVN